VKTLLVRRQEGKRGYGVIIAVLDHLIDGIVPCNGHEAKDTRPSSRLHKDIHHNATSERQNQQRKRDELCVRKRKRSVMNLGSVVEAWRQVKVRLE